MSLSTITHLIAAIVAGLAVWTFQGARLGAEIAEERLNAKEYQLQVSEAKNAANRRVAKASQEIADKYQGALNEARTREITLRRDRDAARSESDSLRDQAATAARRLADAPPAAVLEYASTVNELFAECVRSYQDVAAAATGHAADVRTLIEAWPVNGHGQATPLITHGKSRTFPP